MMKQSFGVRKYSRWEDVSTGGVFYGAACLPQGIQRILVRAATCLNTPRICIGVHFLQTAVLPVFLHEFGIAAAFYNGAAVYN